MNEIICHKLYFINELLEQKSKMDQSKINNLSRGHGRVLAILKKKDNITTKDLAIILGISISALNLLLNRLKKSGFIVKEPSKEDKRVFLIKLTEKGRDFTIEPSVDYNIFDCLDENQKQEFNSSLNSIIKEVLDDIKQQNPEKFEKTTQKRNELVKELFDEEKDKYWFDMYS